jgi:hypothetical protein
MATPLVVPGHCPARRGEAQGRATDTRRNSPQLARVRIIDERAAFGHVLPMVMMPLIRLHRLVLLVTLTVALVATGFGHRMPAPQDEALTFALANGATLADFCGDDIGGDGIRDPHCLSCQIVGTADLPTGQQTLIDLNLAFVAATVAPRESRARARVLDPAHTPQGPPTA